MTENTSAPSTAMVRRSDIAVGESGGLVLRNLAELTAFATMIERTAFCPKHFKGNAEGIAVAIQYGMEIGLRPLQAVREVKVIEGQPGIWSDAMLALVMASGLLEDIDEHFEGDGDAFTAVCITKRRGHSRPYRTEFSVADAKRAGLWDRENWRKYPKRLLPHRARVYNLRDRFGDVVKGIASLEEVQDAEFVVEDDAPKPTLAERIRASAPPSEPEPTGAFSAPGLHVGEPVTVSEFGKLIQRGQQAYDAALAAGASEEEAYARAHAAANAPESPPEPPVGPEPAPEPDRAAEPPPGAKNEPVDEPEKPARARKGRKGAPPPEPEPAATEPRKANFCPKHVGYTDDVLVKYNGAVMCVPCARAAAKADEDRERAEKPSRRRAPASTQASLTTAEGRSAFRQGLEQWNAETQSPPPESELPLDLQSENLFDADEQGDDE